MGQGADSCGGHDIEFDPVEDGLDRGLWQTQDGGEVRVADMSRHHLKNAIRHATTRARCASFSCDSDTWSEWANVLECELATRSTSKPKTTRKPKPTRGAKQKMKCHCGTVYEARKADLARGWAKSCSKRCASIKREYGRPDAKPVVDK